MSGDNTEMNGRQSRFLSDTQSRAGKKPSVTRQRPRTCVACREESPKRALLRIVRTPSGDAVPDVTGKLPGRGAYICLNEECLKKALSSGALSRALKTSVSDECRAELERFVRDGLDDGHDAKRQAKELRSLIGMGRRAGTILIGTDNIRAASQKKPLLLLTVHDCSDATLRLAEGMTLPNEDRRYVHGHIRLEITSEELSASLGAAGVQIIAMPLRSGLADRIAGLVPRIKN